MTIAIEGVGSKPAALRLPGVSSALALIGLLLAWEAGSYIIDLQAFPPASTALRAVPDLLSSAQDRANIGISLLRMTVGYSIALLLAIPLGLLMGRSPFAERLLNPLLMMLYPIPKAALMPLIMLWFGVGDTSKILVITLGVTLPVLFHSYQGALEVNERLLWSACAMGMSPAARALRIVLPAALPEILTGCRVGLAMALIVMVSSEMIARQAGIGNILFNSLDMAIYPTVYAMIIVIGVIGFVADLVFEKVRALLVPWAEPVVDSDD